MKFYQISSWILKHLSNISKNHRKIISAMVYGVMRSRRVGVAAIGRGMQTKTTPRHNIKRAARFLANDKINVEESLLSLQKTIIRKNKNLLLISLDWTLLSNNGYQVLKATVVGDGRGIPFAFKTFKDGELKSKQTSYEKEMLAYLRGIIPDKTKVVIIADRGFGMKNHLVEFIQKIGFFYVARTQENYLIDCDQYNGKIKDFKTEKNKIYQLINATWPGLKHKKKEKQRRVVSNIVLTQKKESKERWVLATNLQDYSAEAIIKIYYKRMTIEETFKDEKNLLYGFALEKMRLTSAKRYDKMLLIISYAYLFLTLFGFLMEQKNMHRKMMANTVKYRSLSLFQVGLFYYIKYDIPISKLMKLIDLVVFKLE